VTYGIRPEHLMLAEDGIEARLVVIEPTGSETQVAMRIADTPLVGAFRERITGRPGETIRVKPDLSLVHLFGSDGRRL
jgi:multiple sugar transport system ATP-binding protein